MSYTLDTLGEHARAAAARGERVFTFANGHWQGFPAGAPIRTVWGTGIARHQQARAAADRKAVDGLAVGESAVCVRGYHPRHGDKNVTVTRVA